MQSEIEDYLRQHGATYTPEALRSQLLRAGYDPVEVNAALRELAAELAPRFAQTQLVRGRYWRSAAVAHLLALAVAVVWVLLGPNASWVFLIAVVLGVVLLVSLVITGVIGRLVVDRWGLGIALLVPVVSAVLLSGWCIAQMSRPLL